MSSFGVEEEADSHEESVRISERRKVVRRRQGAMASSFLTIRA